MKIRITTPALLDYEQAATYLVEHSPAAARQFAVAINTALENLQANPKMGKLTNNGQARQLLLSMFPYKVFYEFSGDTIEIMRIFHTSQDPKKALD